jgi:DNA-binding MarR family transcriptional regulator
VPDPRWLSDVEQQQWRAVVSAFSLLPEQLGRDLSAQHGLSLTDYEILVRLSEAADRRVRMSDLAAAVLTSRSRLSHQITRLERAGLVVRKPCEQDRRGWYAQLTDVGFETLAAAAPDHVESVRRHFMDLLTTKQFESVAAACQVVRVHLEAARPEA